MAKKQTKTEEFSWSDFEADSDLITRKEIIDEEEEEENLEEGDNEEEEEDEDLKSKKKKKKKKKVVDEEEEEEEEEIELTTEEKLAELRKRDEATLTDEEIAFIKANTGDKKADDEEEDDEPDPEEAARFFEAVDKITGNELNINYDGVDPLSPQGVALREKAVKEAALDDWLEEIETKFPEVYQALQYANNGGDIAELFSVASTRDYLKVEIGDEDSDLATEILKEYYQSRGVKNESKIKRLIEADEESEGGIIKEAKSALKELQDEQKDKQAEIIESQTRKAEEQKKKDKLIVAAVDEVLEEGKLGNFKLSSRQEKSEFKEFALKNLRRTSDGKYEFATPIVPGNIEQILKYQYFQFKKGDLAQLIEIKAATKNAEKLRLRAKAEQTKPKKTKEEERKTSLSMKDFNR